jgi:hypothetical protein
MTTEPQLGPESGRGTRARLGRARHAEPRHARPPYWADHGESAPARGAGQTEPTQTAPCTAASRTVSPRWRSPRASGVEVERTARIGQPLLPRRTSLDERAYVGLQQVAQSGPAAGAALRGRNQPVGVLEQRLSRDHSYTVRAFGHGASDALEHVAPPSSDAIAPPSSDAIAPAAAPAAAAGPCGGAP